MLIKAGVDISRLQPKIRKRLKQIETIVWNVINEELIITSTYEGDHGASSLHYADSAIDIRRSNKPDKIVMEIKLALGKDYDVILENNHIHIEYDPIS